MWIYKIDINSGLLQIMDWLFERDRRKQYKTVHSTYANILKNIYKKVKKIVGIG
jgi:hypothetical protein